MGSALRKRASGNTIVEYALCGLLIVCVCIATFNVLGQNLNSIFLRMKNAKNAYGVHSLAMGKGFINKTGGAGSIMVGLSAQNAGLLQEPLAQRLMTTGANGSTEQLAQYLSALVQQKLADGTITQDQANVLLQLANKAHEMASIESMIQTALNNANGSYDAFVAQKFTVNGVTYAADQLTSLLSINQIMSPSNVSSMSDVTSLMNSASNIPADSSVAAFINLFNSAQASGALNDPTISALVNQASTQVTFISDDLTRSIWFNSAGQEGTAFPTPDQVQAREASNATNSQAGTICLAGNGTDTGTTCN